MFPVIPNKEMIEYAETIENLAMLLTVHTVFVEFVEFVEAVVALSHTDVYISDDQRQMRLRLSYC